MNLFSDPVSTQRTIAGRQRALMRWYRLYGRHHLPWRKTRDPYQVLVSEIMLQQTQVPRVMPYWKQWVRRWSTVEALASAKRADVIRAWAGLGYNRRAVYLHQFAQEVVRDPGLRATFSHSAECENVVRSTNRPFSISCEIEKGNLCAYLAKQAHRSNRVSRMTDLTRQLQKLPGVGPYTANALLSYAFGMDAPVVDTNVRRVLAHAIYRRPAIMRMPLRRVMEIAARAIPKGQGRNWNFALMDYGALVLTARSVKKCPTLSVGHLGRRRKVERFEGSSRFWRGRIVAVLRSSRHALTMRDLRSRITAFGVPPGNLRSLVSALIRDGVVTAVRYRYRLPTT